MSHKYKSLPPEAMEDLLSTFLINSWSYSKVTTFARNQKVFEMEYIYGLWGKQSASGIAGKGYHKGLDYFFSQYKEGELIELPALQQTAYESIGAVPANRWKLSKTNPTMEEAVEDALKVATNVLQFFYEEKGIYLDEIEEILGVELYFDEFLTIDGVDIPLPCHGLMDLVFRRKEAKGGGIIIDDHKSTSTYTDEKEAALIRGQQAIVYALAYEAMTGETVSEVWFTENKHSKNKSGAPQLQNIAIKLDKDSRALYEHLLYQNLRQMISAVRDPDFVYTINVQDNFVDLAELLDFCMRTEICEVEDFNVSEGKRDLVKKRLAKVRNASGGMINPQIIKNFRDKAASFIKYDLSVTNMTPQEKIEHTFKTFGKMVRVAQTFEGYSSSTFLIEVSAGVMVKDLFKHNLDVANALDAPNARFSKELVKYEGKSYVSMDIDKVRTESLLYNPDHRDGFKIPIGKDNFGRTVYWDMDNQSTPHMMVCGATGSGKSVFLDCIIAYAKEAGINNIIILDVKKEFGKYAGPGVDVINKIRDIEAAVKGCVDEMDQRIDAGISEKVLVVFDEYPNAVEKARKGPELKRYDDVMAGNYANGMPKFKRECVGEDASLSDNMGQLLEKGRSSGFRVIVGMQRASTQIISGDMKNNMPVRVCFSVQKIVDSQVVLDEAGAEKLQGKGDGLLRSPEYRDTVRFQSYYKPQNVTA